MIRRRRPASPPPAGEPRLSRRARRAERRDARADANLRSSSESETEPAGPPSLVVGAFRLLGRGLRALVFPVLAAAVVSLVLLIGMFPARSYLEQKESIAEAQTRLTQLTADNQAAEEELARLNTDPEIERVAREQYGLVKPGEEVYHVMPAPQDPIAVPDVWPFNGMRQRMKAQPPAVIDPAAAGATTTTPAAPSTTTTSGAASGGPGH